MCRGERTEDFKSIFSFFTQLLESHFMRSTGSVIVNAFKESLRVCDVIFAYTIHHIETHKRLLKRDKRGCVIRRKAKTKLWQRAFYPTFETAVNTSAFKINLSPKRGLWGSERFTTPPVWTGGTITAPMTFNLGTTCVLHLRKLEKTQTCPLRLQKYSHLALLVKLQFNTGNHKGPQLGHDSTCTYVSLQCASVRLCTRGH